MNGTLYVVTTLFNPSGFSSRTRLYRNFARHMEQSGVRLLTVEAAFGDHDYEVTEAGNPWNVQLRTDQVLWHKERLINLGLQRLYHIEPRSHYLGWFDCDVTFANADWVRESIHKLMHHPVIQPFGQAISLDANEEYMWDCPSSFRKFIDQRGYHQEPPLPLTYTFGGHPGLAWCATRPALDRLGGVYDECAAGSGDTVMSNCLKGGWDQYLPARPSAGMQASIQRWAARCDRHIEAKVGYTRGALLHHWHGKSEDRGYEKRWSISSFHDFDPLTDLVVDSQGLYRWAGNKPRLEDDVRLSLTSRNEDRMAA
jgi:hypothetical protein